MLSWEGFSRVSDVLFGRAKKSLEMGTKRIFGAYSTRVGDLFQRYFGGEMRMINHHGVFLMPGIVPHLSAQVLVRNYV